MLPWLPPFPVTKTWDESKHPRDDAGKWAERRNAARARGRDRRAADAREQFDFTLAHMTDRPLARDLYKLAGERFLAALRAPSAAELIAAADVPGLKRAVEDAVERRKKQVMAAFFDGPGASALAGLSLDQQVAVQEVLENDWAAAHEQSWADDELDPDDDRPTLLNQIRDDWVAGAWAGDRAADWDAADTTDHVAEAIYDGGEGGAEDDEALDAQYEAAQDQARRIVAAFVSAAGLPGGPVGKAFGSWLPSLS